jgi:hypothetical protein
LAADDAALQLQPAALLGQWEAAAQRALRLVLWLEELAL